MTDVNIGLVFVSRSRYTRDMIKPDKTSADRTARYKRKKLLVDMIRVNVWIPTKARMKLLEYAEDLRKLQGLEE